MVNLEDTVLHLKITRDVGRSNAPILEIEMLGSHTLTDVARAMFKHRLEQEVGEALSAHLWMFHRPGDNFDHLDVQTPLKQPGGIKNVYLDDEEFDDPEVGAPRGVLAVREGAKWVFRYDSHGSNAIALTVTVAKERARED